jgi:rhamnose utilization protein RhaD (predicted bifunctional aldolase and dehydrogenase)
VTRRADYVSLLVSPHETPTMSALRGKLELLIALSADLGAERRELAILGEGNTSVRVSDKTFLVKASGSSLATLTENDLVECRFAPLLSMLDRDDLNDQEIEDALFGCRVKSNAKKPSVEALFHAYLLSLSNITYVGHTHSIAINKILCSPRSVEFAERRMFPDEIVCCGPMSILIPYTDPGLRLAQMIRHSTRQFMETFNTPPRVILLENHGIITLGATPSAVKAAMFMADKAAHIFAGAVALGGPNFLPPDQVDRIGNRIDEHYRQRALKL